MGLGGVGYVFLSVTLSCQTILLTWATSSSKSQLAIEFAHQVAERSADKWVFWVHAGTRTRVEQGFRSIAEAVKLPGRNQSNADISSLVSGWLSNERNGRWVMILDSADDIDVFYGEAANTADGRPLASYLPQSGHGSILVTTRNRNLASRLVGDHRDIISVGPMTERNALLLVEKRLGRPLFDEEVTVAADLVRALDLIPLPISQAAAYIQARAPRSSLKKYLAEFRESESNRARLLGHDAGDLRREGSASNSIRTTWEISFNYIRSKRPSAADLLSLMSFFDPQGIPESLLKPNKQTRKATCSTRTQEENKLPTLRVCRDGVMGGSKFPSPLLKKKRWWRVLSDLARLKQGPRSHTTRASGREETETEYADAERSESGNPDSGHPGSEHRDSEYSGSESSDYETDDRFEDDVEMLRDYCLVTVNEGGYVFDMHGLVQLSTRKWLETCGVQEAFRKRYIKRLVAAFPDPNNYKHWSACQKLFTHVVAAIDLRPAEGRIQETWADLMLQGGGYAFWQGSYDVAERMVRQAKRVYEERFGPEHEATLESILVLGLVFSNKRLDERAEELLIQVMETRKSVLGADHPDTLLSMGYLATMFRKQGRLQEAEKLWVKAMEAMRTNLGADHPHTLRSLQQLASINWDQVQFEETEKLGVLVVEARKINLGADHPDTLTSTHSLASFWKAQGRDADAWALMKSCAETKRRVLGPKHPSTLFSLETLDEWSNDESR